MGIKNPIAESKDEFAIHRCAET